MNKNDKNRVIAPGGVKTKTILTANETLQINSTMKTTVQDVNKLARELVKKYLKTPEQLMSFIESNGTPVVRMDGIEKVLAYIGETEGFLAPMSGAKAFILTFVSKFIAGTDVKVGFKSPAMFVARKGNVNLYFLSQNFYHWLSYYKGLPGYEQRTQSIFKNVWSNDFSASGMSVKDILALKQAIARDNESINFVREITREFVGSKTSVDKIKAGSSVNI